MFMYVYMSLYMFVYFFIYMCFARSDEDQAYKNRYPKSEDGSRKNNDPYLSQLDSEVNFCALIPLKCLKYLFYLS